MPAHGCSCCCRQRPARDRRLVRAAAEGRGHATQAPASTYPQPRSGAVPRPSAVATLSAAGVPPAARPGAEVQVASVAVAVAEAAAGGVLALAGTAAARNHACTLDVAAIRVVMIVIIMAAVTAAAVTVMRGKAVL